MNLSKYNQTQHEVLLTHGHPVDLQGGDAFRWVTLKDKRLAFIHLEWIKPLFWELGNFWAGKTKNKKKGQCCSYFVPEGGSKAISE